MEIKGASMLDQLRMIRGVEPIVPQPADAGAPKGDGAKKVSFAEMLENTLQEANAAGLEADHKIQQTLAGENPNPHETMIAIQKADVSFRLMLTVKDQIEQAYQQILRTSIG